MLLSALRLQPSPIVQPSTAASQTSTWAGCKTSDNRGGLCRSIPSHGPGHSAVAGSLEGCPSAVRQAARGVPRRRSSHTGGALVLGCVCLTCFLFFFFFCRC